jgi:predicted site-specific integrase-resolvase
MYYTKEEVASIFGISILTVDNWVAFGKLVKIRFNSGKFKFEKELVDALLKIEIAELTVKINKEESLYKEKKAKLSKKLEYLQSKL